MHYEKILRALYKHEIRYIVVGGLAVNLHGIPRMTVDLDIVVDMSETNLHRLLSLLSEMDYVPRLPLNPEDIVSAEFRQKWIEERNMIAFSFIGAHRQTNELDIMLKHPLDFDKAYTRCTFLPVEDYEIPLISIEDLQTMKQDSARSQDFADIEMLERVKNELKSE